MEVQDTAGIRGINGLHIGQLSIAGIVQIRERGSGQHQRIHPRPPVEDVCSDEVNDSVRLTSGGDVIGPCTTNDRKGFALVHKSQRDAPSG